MSSAHKPSNPLPKTRLRTRFVVPLPLEEKRRVAAVNAAQVVTKTLVGSMNEGVAQIFQTQKQLEGEVRHLQTSLVKYTKLSNQWVTMIDGFNQALKEIGDVENWAQRIEADMRTIAEGLEHVHEGDIAAQAPAVAAVAEVPSQGTVDV